MKKVIDAHALMVYLEREPGFEKVSELFSQAAEKGVDLLMSAVNFGEVYYIVLRECGRLKAEEIVRTIEAFPIDILAADKELAQVAGNFKASKKMSYADCFAAALAKVNKAELITGDEEFREVEKEISVRWL